MSNMSYCRFRNTLSNLRECYDAIGNGDELSAEEEHAKNRLLLLCDDIAGDFDDDIEELREHKTKRVLP